MEVVGAVVVVVSSAVRSTYSLWTLAIKACRWRGASAHDAWKAPARLALAVAMELTEAITGIEKLYTHLRFSVPLMIGASRNIFLLVVDLMCIV